MRRTLRTAAAILAISIIVATISFHDKLDIIAFNPNPLVRHFAPTWRSLKKIIDIPYIIRGTLTTSDIPTYNITLSRNDLRRLLDNLPDFPRESRLYEEFKGTIKAKFTFKNYATSEAKMRFRGKSPSHWNALKKSWQVELPAEAPLGERTVFRFFIPEDRGWAQLFMWNEIRKKFGLITLDTSPARLTVNERDMGVYILIDGWEEGVFEKNRRQFGKIFSDKNIDTRGTQDDLFMPEAGYRWYERNDPEEKGGEQYPELMYLLELTAHAPDDVFAREISGILDMDTFLKWTFVSALSGNFHPGNNRENMNLYFDPATGLFEPVSVDANVTKITKNIDLTDNRLVNRVLAIEQHRKQFEAIARSYLLGESNLSNDLATYDMWAAILLSEAYRDITKVETSYETAHSIAQDRKTYEANFRVLETMLKEKNAFAYHFADESYPLRRSTTTPAPRVSHDSFRAISQTRQEFLQANPQFTPGKDSNVVIILPGTHVFSKTVVIPRGLSVIIRESTTLNFNSGISLISYSPVTARGSATGPITFQPSPGYTSWGVVAVVCACSNDFQNVTIRDGSEAYINGLYFSGSLSIHGGNMIFDHSTVTRSHADDGIHILQGTLTIRSSLFMDTSSDGIDIDFAQGNNSLVEQNIFRNIAGDAMDLSFSRIALRDNIVLGCGDKGISVGEVSEPIIERHVSIGCAYGIAVKDRSRALITQSYLLKNKIGIGLYIKKPHFISGGSATISKSVLWGNEKAVSKDALSAIAVEQSTIEGGYIGKDINDQAPDFVSLLPRAALNFFNAR